MMDSAGFLVGAYVSYWMIGMAAAYMALPGRGSGPYRVGAAISVALGTLIPLYGPLIAPLYALYCRSAARRRIPPDMQPIVLPEYAWSDPVKPSREAMGSIAARLSHAAREEDRIHAVSRILAPRHPEQYRLLNLALADPAEEVRLLAHSTLDRREHDNTQLMIRLGEQLQRTPDAQRIVRDRLVEQRAWLAWSIAHQGAAAGTAAAAPAEAGTLSCARPSLALLQALAELESGASLEACQSLDVARSRGLPEYLVAPHLAAAYLKLGKFSSVRGLMARLPSLRLSPRYGASAGFWQDPGS